MSIRFPSRIDAPRIGAPVKKEMRFTTTDWTDWKFLKSRLVDAVFVGMILVSILGARLRVVALGSTQEQGIPPTTQPAVKNPRAFGRATIAAAMTLDEFSATVVRNEQPEFIELDLRPFGTLQGDALEFWLDLAIKQGDPFRKKVAIKTGASVILSERARATLAKLQEQGVSFSVIGER